MFMKRVGIVGMGRAGSVLAYKMAQEGYRIQTVPHHPIDGPIVIKDRAFPALTLTDAARQNDVLLIAVPDKAIGEVVQSLSLLEKDGLRAVLHLSGAVSVDILAPLRHQGLSIGALHPLQSLADIEQALVNLPGSTLMYEGDPDWIGWVRELADGLGCRLAIAPPDLNRALYHAGASIASNFLVTLAAMGIRCLTEAGLAEEDARNALMALMKGTLNNLTSVSPAGALTGPIVRGDTETVRAHLDALNANLPALAPAYETLAEQTAAMAREAGLLPEPLFEQLNEILGQSKGGHPYVR
jgi:predicted short-subunit dehydrogenase-like oxidoreductase (DUF2520 family)